MYEYIYKYHNITLTYKHAERAVKSATQQNEAFPIMKHQAGHASIESVKDLCAGIYK